MAEPKNEADAGQALHDLFREIFALHATLSGIMDQVHLRAGLITSHHKILRILSPSGPMTVPEVASRLGVSRQFVQTACNDLQTRGFIEFAQNPRHKRSKLVVITKTGRSASRKAGQRENRIIEQALPGIAPAEVKKVKAFLEKIRTSLPAPPGLPRNA